MKFDYKIIQCNPEDLLSQQRQIELDWVYALLLRFKVDPTVIKEFKQNEHFSKRKWRDFLFDTYGIRIEKNLDTGEISIKRLNFSTYEDVELGRWNTPKIVRVRNKNESYCEIHLDYWHIV